MCEPVSLTVAAASAGANYMGQRQAAKSQEAYQKDLADSIMEQGADRITDLNLRRVEGEEVAARKTEQIKTAIMQQQSQARLGAIEANAAHGDSFNAYMDDFTRHSSKILFGISRDVKSDAYKYLRGMESSNRSTLASLKSNARPIAQASALTSALDFAGDALAIKSEVDKRKPIQPATTPS